MTAEPVQRRGPGSRADEHHPTRKQLLDGALEVAERSGLADLSVAAVTQAAGVAKGTFYVHFADRDALVLAVHRRFHDDLYATVAAATDALPAGRDRLHARLTTFLDGCRKASGVRALLLEARALDELREEMRRRNVVAASTLAEDLRVCAPTGHEAATARLLVAATVEVADAELRAGRRQPALRQALLQLA